MEDDNPFSKAQTIDPEVRAYVYSLVNALGGSSADEDGRYILGDDALACLRDLKRWLKLYDEKLNRLDVARCLAESKLVTGDLLPILASWTEDGRNDKLKGRVALSCMELLVPLTWPLETAGDMTLNHHRHTPYLQQAQVIYKAAILSWDTCSILRQLVRVALPSIALPRDERTNRDEGIIKLLLYLLRNVASIRQIPSLPSQGLEMEVSRSATINVFRDQDIFALLLTICSNMGDDFNLQDVIVLEILFNLTKGVDPKKLWMTSSQRRQQDLSDLKATLAAEKSMDREYKRTAPSRHGRFGTMIWVKREDEKMSAVSGQDNIKEGRALFNMDKSKLWNKPKTKQKDMEHTMHDFNRFQDLSDSATEQLRNFVEEFLDSGFNPLFTHLRKAIEREAERLLDINYRQFLFCVGWFLEAERCRRSFQKQERSSRPPNIDEFESESYSLVASVLNQETFITLNRYMQSAIDNKEHQDVNAAMRCFTQILLTVQEMASSPLEEDQEIAENIQNRIFYEETTHDRVLSMLRNYKDQGFGYLDACTELAHVFLRMLERYSKENVDLQLRSRRKARKKKKREAKERESKTDGNKANDDDPDVDSENEEAAEIAQVSRERKFDFNRFAAKFVTQNSVNTFTSLLSFYRDLTVEQLKRVHRFFYRVAFKQDAAVLLYRVDVIALLYKMAKGPEGLSQGHEMFKEWSEFCRQIFKKLLKKLEERPELMVEMLFSKINATLYYLEFGKEKQTLAMTRPPAELEIKPSLDGGREVREQIGIAVTVLMRDEKGHLVQWVRGGLTKAIEARLAWEMEAEARKEGGQDADDAGATPSSVSIRPSSDEIKTAMFRNARLKLLMKLCGMQILGDDDALGALWTVPGSITSEQLKEHQSAIEYYAANGWKADNEDEEPEDMLRRARTATARGDGYGEPQRDGFIASDSEGQSDIDEAFLFPDNPRRQSDNKRRDILAELKSKRRKRKRGSDGEDEDGDEEAAAARRKARKEANDARRRRFKSDAYIHDSDDESDEEKDVEFFRREEEVRGRQEDNIRRQIALGIGGQGMSALEHKVGTERAREIVRDTVMDEGDKLRGGGDDDDDDEREDAGEETASSQPVRMDGSEDDDAETPLSSQSSGQPGSEPKQAGGGLSEIRQPRAGDPARKTDVEMDVQEPDEPVPTARRRVRGGFIVDSDEDE